MKKSLILFLISLLFSQILFAKNEIHRFSIQKAMQSEDFKKYLDPNITFIFGSGYEGDFIVKQVKANRKANGVGKSDEKSCQRALLNSLLALQNKALKLGSTKIVNITSFYYKNHFDSKTHYECGSGALMSGVTLRADIVK